MKHRDPKIRLAKNFMEHVWLERSHEGLDEFLSPKVLVKSPVKQNVGVDTLESAFSVWFRGFPCLRYREKKIQIIDDRVNIDWEVTGNHLGKFFGFTATGKPVQYSGNTELVMFDGKIHLYSADVKLSSVIQQISPDAIVTPPTAGDDIHMRVNQILALNLTKRQIDCLALLCLRCDNSIISSKLNISYNTFRTHIERTLPFIGLSSKKEVFDWALSNHVLELLIHIALEKVR